MPPALLTLSYLSGFWGEREQEGAWVIERALIDLVAVAPSSFDINSSRPFFPMSLYQ
jgi:hypothetical protein